MTYHTPDIDICPLYSLVQPAAHGGASTQTRAHHLSYHCDRRSRRSRGMQSQLVARVGERPLHCIDSSLLVPWPPRATQRPSGDVRDNLILFRQSFEGPSSHTSPEVSIVSRRLFVQMNQAMKATAIGHIKTNGVGLGRSYMTKISRAPGETSINRTTTMARSLRVTRV